MKETSEQTKPEVMTTRIEEQVRKIGERLRKEYRAEKVILFGSYATGEATQDSDIDLLIIAPRRSHSFRAWPR